MPSSGNCHRRCPREGAQLSTQFRQRTAKAILHTQTYRAVPAERAGFTVRRREAAEQIGVANGLIRQRTLRKVLLRASEIARRLARGWSVGLPWVRARFGWRRAGLVRRWAGFVWRWAGFVWRWVWIRGRSVPSRIRTLELSQLPSSTCDALMNCLPGTITTTYECPGVLRSGVSRGRRRENGIKLTELYVHELIEFPA